MADVSSMISYTQSHISEQSDIAYVHGHIITAWSKKARPAHIFAFIFQTPNVLIFGKHEQQFIANTMQQTLSN